jgi:hypothetical protein
MISMFAIMFPYPNILCIAVAVGRIRFNQQSQVLHVFLFLPQMHLK